MNLPACHCAHSLYSNHQCSGLIVNFELPEGRLVVCEGCMQHIINFDLMLNKRNLLGFIG